MKYRIEQSVQETNSKDRESIVHETHKNALRLII